MSPRAQCESWWFPSGKPPPWIAPLIQHGRRVFHLHQVHFHHVSPGEHLVAQWAGHPALPMLLERVSGKAAIGGVALPAHLADLQTLAAVLGLDMLPQRAAV